MRNKSNCVYTPVIANIIKKTKIHAGLVFIVILNACGQDKAPQRTNNQHISPASGPGISQNETIPINPEGLTLETRIIPPEGFQRKPAQERSFSAYLRNLPLKPHGEEVKLYNGNTKPNYNIYDAVVDLDIGEKDLHQCADAVMRLRAEFLWAQKQYDKIHFNFTNGFRVDYSEWMKGKRIAVKGNKTFWAEGGATSNSHQDFWEYLEIIFNYSGTLSLAKELTPVSITDLEIGDVFIQGGSPGHAVIVVDLAFNSQTNKKIFLLAQSFMPAQEIQILKNPHNSKISPWYLSDFGAVLTTPEWTFSKTDLKRFEE